MQIKFEPKALSATIDSLEFAITIVAEHQWFTRAMEQQSAAVVQELQILRTTFMAAQHNAAEEQRKNRANTTDPVCPICHKTNCLDPLCDKPA